MSFKFSLVLQAGRGGGAFCQVAGNVPQTIFLSPLRAISFALACKRVCKTDADTVHCPLCVPSHALLLPFRTTSTS